MGWKAWLLAAAAVAFLLTTVRLHFMPGQFGDHVTFEFVAPWR
jgi:hypothetical protein